ncbi:hypothetical protein TrRE_jg2867, partial [Triparma retinervis]
SLSLGTETDAGSTAQNNYLVDLSRALNNLIQRYADRAVVADIPGLQDNESGEVYHQPVASMIVREVEKRLEEEKRRKEFPMERREKRRTAAVQMQIDQQLVGRLNSSTGFRVSKKGIVHVRDKFVDKLGFPEEGFLDFKLSVRRAMWITSVCMLKMLLCTMLVALVAQLIKVTGNKALVLLCTIIVEDTDPWCNEVNLFIYEYSTALLCRFLQISLPDQNIAIGVSLFAALLEMGCRNFYFLLYVKAALKSSATFNAEEWRKFAIRGKMRVADASNDMIVEYLSTISAAVCLYYLGPTGAFSFAADESVSTGTIITIVGFQLIPELFLDFYCTFIEVFGGLSKIHIAQWSFRAGKRINHQNRFYRWGDFPKWFILKLVCSVLFLTLPLLTCLKTD